MISLTKAEVHYLAGVLWWLDRVRSKAYEGSQGERSGAMYSSADGGASMYEFNQGKATAHYSGKTRWWGSPSSRWVGEYSKEVCANLSGDFVERIIPEMLGERWSEYAALKHRNLMTSDKDRMSQRHNEVQMQIFRDCFQEVFKMHKDKMVPAEVLGWLARAAGDLGMSEFRLDLSKLQEGLNSRSDEEKEFEALKKELKDKERPFLFLSEKNPDKEAMLKKFTRMDDLEILVQLDFHHYLREYLNQPLEKLSAAGDLGKLTKMALRTSEKINTSYRGEGVVPLWLKFTTC